MTIKRPTVKEMVLAQIPKSNLSPIAAKLAKAAGAAK
jgi:hypothetical protein